MTQTIGRTAARHIVVMIGAALLAAPASAAIDCLMPNGKTITFQTRDACPADASQVDAQGNVVRPPIPRPAPPKPTPSSPSSAQPSATAPRSRPAPSAPMVVTVYEAADAMCSLLKRGGAATQCEVDPNILSNSYINITSNATPRQAMMDCSIIASSLRQSTSLEDRRLRTWEIRIFSPFSGSRPIAACYL